MHAVGAEQQTGNQSVGGHAQFCCPRGGCATTRVAARLISNLSLDGARRAIALMRPTKSTGRLYVGRRSTAVIDTAPASTASISRVFSTLSTKAFNRKRHWSAWRTISARSLGAMMHQSGHVTQISFFVSLRRDVINNF